MNKHDLKVGQEIFINVIARHRKDELEAVTIRKIGRKWATCGEGYRERRVDLETLRVDNEGFGYPQTAYLSRETYEAEQRRSLLQTQLCQYFRDSYTRISLTNEELEQIHAIVFKPAQEKAAP